MASSSGVSRSLPGVGHCGLLQEARRTTQSAQVAGEADQLASVDPDRPSAGAAMRRSARSRVGEDLRLKEIELLACQQPALQHPRQLAQLVDQ